MQYPTGSYFPIIWSPDGRGYFVAPLATWKIYAKA